MLGSVLHPCKNCLEKSPIVVDFLGNKQYNKSIFDNNLTI